MQINTTNLTKEIADEFDTTAKEVDKVMHSIFGFVRKTMTEEPEKSVRLKRLGIFIPKKVYYNRKKKK